MFYLAFFHGDLLCGIFARDESIILAGADYLKAYAIDCLFTCFLFCFIGFYNGLGYTGFVSVQGVAAAFLVRIPVAILMRRVLGTLFGIGLGVPVATVFQILACFIFLWQLHRNHDLKLYAD
jgi:Na+-driven multidrug efflux pump